MVVPKGGVGGVMGHGEKKYGVKEPWAQRQTYQAVLNRNQGTYFYVIDLDLEDPNNKGAQKLCYPLTSLEL